MSQVKGIPLIILAYLVLTYSGLAPLGSLLIIILARRVWAGKALRMLGLEMPRRQIRVSAALVCAFTIGSFLVIAAVTKSEGIVFVPPWIYGGWALLFTFNSIGQTLNEEMILGTLLLKGLKARFPSLHMFVVAAMVGMLFSLLHYGFYLGALSVSTLVSLFFVGVARNNFILATRHIGYAWAIHLGWNVVFFSSSFFSVNSSGYISTSSAFNDILGHISLLTITFLLMLTSILFSLRRMRMSSSIAGP